MKFASLTDATALCYQIVKMEISRHLLFGASDAEYSEALRRVAATSYGLDENVIAEMEDGEIFDRLVAIEMDNYFK